LSEPAKGSLIPRKGNILALFAQVVGKLGEFAHCLSCKKALEVIVGLLFHVKEVAYRVITWGCVYVAETEL